MWRIFFCVRQLSCDGHEKEEEEELTKLDCTLTQACELMSKRSHTWPLRRPGEQSGTKPTGDQSNTLLNVPSWL